MGMLAGRIWRDDGLDPSLGEFLAQAVGIIGPVGENSLGPMAHREQATHSDKVVDVAGCDQQDVGRPISSVSAWILVVCPPRERPMALLKAPLLRRLPSGGL